MAEEITKVVTDTWVINHQGVVLRVYDVLAVRS